MLIYIDCCLVYAAIFLFRWSLSATLRAHPVQPDIQPDVRLNMYIGTTVTYPGGTYTSSFHYYRLRSYEPAMAG